LIERYAFYKVDGNPGLLGLTDHHIIALRCHRASGNCNVMDELLQIIVFEKKLIAAINL
jgi:hypothetical protein